MQNEPENIANQTVELGDILEADQVAFTMDTIGWKILFGIIVLLTLQLLYKYYKVYKNNAYRRAAILNIKQLEQTHQNSNAHLIIAIMFQLKQTALETYNKTEVASLKGLEWLQFLDHKGKTTHFSKYETTIMQALYKNEVDETHQFNSSDFIASSIKWIKTHV